ncbi:MAG: ArsR/SmtB family transcription factor [Candidatus Hodarchaeota archaeon]
MRPLKIIRDPECCQLIGDETRRRIIFLLRAKPMNISQIAETLKLSPPTVYHHIQKLKKADMVEVTYEKRCGHLIESYYQATAEVFHFILGESPQAAESHKEAVKSIIDGLNRLGFGLKYDEKTAEEIVAAEKKLDSFKDNEEFIESVSKFEDINPIYKQSIVWIAKLLSASDKEHDERLDLQKKFRKLYKSLKEPNRSQ